MPRPIRSQKNPGPAYLQLWKVVDGAVRDAFANHPDYLARPERLVLQSVVKRVTGQLYGFVGKPTRGRPAGSSRPSA